MKNQHKFEAITQYIKGNMTLLMLAEILDVNIADLVALKRHWISEWTCDEFEMAKEE